VKSPRPLCSFSYAGDLFSALADYQLLVHAFVEQNLYFNAPVFCDFSWRTKSDIRDLRDLSTLRVLPKVTGLVDKTSPITTGYVPNLGIQKNVHQPTIHPVRFDSCGIGPTLLPSI
jgi:hypothetical protein